MGSVGDMVWDNINKKVYVIILYVFYMVEVGE